MAMAMATKLKVLSHESVVRDGETQTTMTETKLPSADLVGVEMDQRLQLLVSLP